MSIAGKFRNVMPLEEAAMSDTAATQLAGLCWRRRGGEVEVLLVTSRDTGRWIIPKGWPMKGLAASEAALREAYEEAGVRGTVTSKRLGYYSYVKVMGEDSGIPCRVGVYAIRVDRLLEKYPEQDERRRKWFSPEKAARKVDEPDLAELLRSFRP